MAPRARFLVLAVAAWLAVLAGTAAAVADHSVSVKSFSFTDAASSTATTVVAEGDSVTWHWDGPGTGHSVTADAGQSMSFDSDASNPTHSHPVGDSFTVVFPTSGCFQYHCNVHAFMHGQVQVGTGFCPPPPPPSDGGGGGGGGGNAPPPPPPPAPPAASDTAPPRVSAVRLRAKTKKLVFKLSESARVTIKVKRGAKAVKTFHVSGRKGANTFRLSHRGLRQGRYKLLVTAVDHAGNRSRVATLKLKI